MDGSSLSNLIDSFADNWSQLGLDLDGKDGETDNAGRSVALSSDGTWGVGASGGAT